MGKEWEMEQAKCVEELKGKYNFFKNDFYLASKVKETFHPLFS